MAVAACIGPFQLQNGVEHAAVRDAGQTVLERQLFELSLQCFEFLFGFLALTDVEHETDQCFYLAVLVPRYMHHIANPDVIPVGSQGAVVRLVVGAGL